MTTAGSGERPVLISFSRADQSWARWIAWQIQQAGLTAALETWDFRPRAHLAREMERTLTRAGRTIALLSPAYLSALRTAPEWTVTMSAPPEDVPRHLAVRVRECRLEGPMSEIRYVDLVGLDEPRAALRLLDAMVPASPDPPRRRQSSGAHDPTRGKPPFPGTLPPVWSVPWPRNPAFIGREARITHLRTALAEVGTTTLTGLPGAGKTQVALEYAHRFAPEYDVVWWLRGDTPERLAEDAAALGRALQPDAERLSLAEVRRLLDVRGRWLLVIDEAEAPEAAEPLVAQRASGHVIFVSGGAYSRGGGELLPVSSMVPAKAIELLLSLTDEADEEAAAAIAECLGYQPLALETGAREVVESGRTLAAYRDELLGGPEALDRHVEAALALWEPSFCLLARDAPEAATIVDVCAFLAPRDIPRELFAAGTEALPELLLTVVGDDVARRKAMRTLHRLGFATFAGGSLTFSSLTQAAARRRLGAEGPRWAAAAVQLINRAFPFRADDASTWSACARLRAHAFAAAGHAERLGVAGAASARVLNQVGVYLLERGSAGEARHALELARRLGEGSGEPEAELATVLNNLGAALEALGDLPRAREQYELALALDEQEHGPDDRVVAIRLNNLAAVLERLGEPEAALDCYERALGIERAQSGDEDPNVARRLGGLLERRGDAAGAQQHYERALELEAAIGGLDRPEAARVRNDLGLLLWSRGDPETGETHLRLALETQERSYGLDHPELATVLVNLAGLLQATGRPDEALRHLERALAITDSAGATAASDLIRVLTHLGEVQVERGDQDAALQAFTRLRLVAAVSSPPNRLAEARANAQIGALLAARGDDVGARDALAHAVRGLEAVGGPWQAELAPVLGRLGASEWRLGARVEARAHFDQAIGLHVGRIATDPAAADGVAELAKTLVTLGETEAAERSVRNVLAVAAAADTPGPTLARLLTTHGALLVNQEEYAAARVPLERALALSAATGQGDDRLTVMALRNLGLALRETGDAEEARDCFARALAAHALDPDADPVEVGFDLAHAAALDEDIGQPSAARRKYERALDHFEQVLGAEHELSSNVRERLKASESGSRIR